MPWTVALEKMESAGDSCFASTVLLSGKIHIQVEKAGGETVAAQIGDILLRTADYRSSVQSRGKQIIDRWAFPTLGFSALALWPIGGEGALAILNAGFGCHMRFAAPIAVLNFLRMASQHGLLIKLGRAVDSSWQPSFHGDGRHHHSQPHPKGRREMS